MCRKWQIFRSFSSILLGLAALLCLPACARDSAYSPQLNLGFGSTNTAIEPRTSAAAGFTHSARAPAQTGSSATSDPFFSADETGPAAKLRDDMSKSFASTAPSDRDWREISGISRKGPTIIGLGLRYDLSNEKWSYRMGAMKRGSRSKVLTRLSLTLDEM